MRLERIVVLGVFVFMVGLAMFLVGWGFSSQPAMWAGRVVMVVGAIGAFGLSLVVKTREKSYSGRGR